MIADELLIKVQADTQDAEQNLSNVSKKSDEVEGSFKDTSKSSGGLMGSFKKLNPKILAAVAAFAAVAREVGQSLKAWSEYEDALVAVESAIEMTGANVNNLLPQYERLASEIQSVTTTSDNQALSLIALAKNLGLTGDEVEEVVKGAIGLEQTLGISAERGVRQLSRALEGNTSSLRRYIPQLENASSEAEELEIIQRRMTDSFTAAQNATDTLSGRQAQLSNSISDVREQIGRLFLGPASDLLGWVNGLVTNVADAVQGFNDLRDAIDRVDEGEGTIEDELTIANAELRSINQQIERTRANASRIPRSDEVLESLREQRNEIAAQIENIRRRQRAEEQLAQAQADRDEEAEKAAQKEAEAAEKQRQQLEARLEVLDQYNERRRVARELAEVEAITEEEMLERKLTAAQQYLEQMAQIGQLDQIQADRTIEYIEELKRNLEWLEDGDYSMPSMQDIMESAKDAMLRARLLRGELYELGSAFTDAGFDATALENVEAIFKEAEEAARRQAELEAEQRAQTRAEFERMTESNITAIRRQRDEFIEAGVDEVDAARWATKQIAQEYMGMVSQVGGAAMSLSSTIVQSQNQSTRNKINNIQEELSKLEERHNTELELAEAGGATQAELENMKRNQLEKRQEAEQEADEKERELREKQFRREQALSISQAVMNTAQAVTNALTAGPIAGPILAGTIASLGAAEVGVIASQQPPAFEKGGSFETRGEQLIRVGDGQSPRERVTVEPLSGPYKGSANRGETINVTINGVVGGREVVAEWVDKGIRRAKERGKL